MSTFFIKGLIYLVIIFVTGFINVLIGEYLGFKIGYLLIIPIEFWLAHLLCQKYEIFAQKRKNKSHLISPDKNNISEEKKGKKSEKEKKIKTIYCKRCGNIIDRKTKQCTGCNKQYFSFKKIKHPLFYFLLLIFFAISLCVNIHQYFEIEDIDKSYAHCRDLYYQQRDKLSFYEEHAVIVTEAGKKYHKYDCHHWDSPFWIYNTEAAKSKGYTACSDCFPTNGKQKVSNFLENKIKERQKALRKIIDDLEN